MSRLSRVFTLWRPPLTSPTTGKALSIPLLNVRDKHGRMFLFSTLGFMMAFLGWYAFPPLLVRTVKEDLQLSETEIANSNIVALTATLLVRLVCGPLIDHYGPRRIFALLLLLGAVPTALAGTATTPAGLVAIRFFIGILGGTFVPCQVWAAEFFDSSVVGTAAGISAGVGNAGGGVVYFLMPSLVDGFVSAGLSEGRAWRVAFVIPFVLIAIVAVGMMACCDDTPNGAWRRRGKGVEKAERGDDEKSMAEIVVGEEANRKPTPAWRAVWGLQTALVANPYAMTFGGELAINAVLGSWMQRNLGVSQTKSGRLASVFTLANVLFRPLGGYLSDALSTSPYYSASPLKARKHLLLLLTALTGLALLLLGLCNPSTTSEFMGLVVLLAVVMDAANGACLALVQAMTEEGRRGVVSGAVGGAGSLGGLVAAVVLRFCGWERGCWGWGVGSVLVGIGVGWIGVREREEGKEDGGACVDVEVKEKRRGKVEE